MGAVTQRAAKLKATLLRAAGFIAAYFALAELGVPLRMDAIDVAREARRSDAVAE